MKYLKPFLATLAVGLCMTSAHAAQSYEFSRNNLPQTLVFHLAQPGGNTATLTFPKALIPVTFSCYFASGTQKGFSATFSSEDNIPTFTNTDSTLNSGSTEVQMFKVTAVKTRKLVGEVNIQVTSDNPQLKIATMMCIMGK